MRIALYGLPCAGKTTLLSELKGLKFVCGSEMLNSISGNSFQAMTEREKQSVRVKYTEYLRSLTDEIVISDGHYSFLDNVVFTDEDAEIYDVILYLYCEPKILKERLSASEKNNKFSDLSVARLEQWQDFEIERLREECHRRFKDFYVIHDSPLSNDFLLFIEKIKNGYSSLSLAKDIVKKIRSVYPKPCRLNIVDGDKTVIKQDSFSILGNGSTKVFDGSFYTGYQSLLFNKETENHKFDCHKLCEIELNELVFDRIKGENFIVLSSGITELWRMISDKFGFETVFANPLISADTKYFVVKILRNAGYQIIAYGDSKIDLYMLKAANEGYIYIGSRMSRSLYKTDTGGLNLIYDKAPYILSENCGDIDKEIEICKSNSAINGSRLALSHILLGQKLGEIMHDSLPNKNAALIVLERGGRFFGDGVYSSFGGVFYPYNPARDNLPVLQTPPVIVLADSVINTGRSITKLIDTLKTKYPKADIVIAANVIQRKALDKIKEYKLFAVRVSDNFFVGERQNVQIGDKGPDTAERLFNLI